MQIKRFEAKTMTQALKMVKEEFGPEAVILSARSLREGRGLLGLGRPTGVEVTAARDSGWGFASLTRSAEPTRRPEEAAADVPAKAPPGGMLRTLNRAWRQLAVRPQAGAGREPEARAALPDAELARHLLAGGLREDLAEEIAAALRAAGFGAATAEPAALRAHLLAALGGLGVRSRPPAAEWQAGGPAITALVGPAGVGKTTTAVKLAVREMRRGLRTGLLTLDDRRIGAVQQLETCAAIIGAPFAAAAGAAQIGAALARFAGLDRLIVDTPGVGPADDALRAELHELLGGLPGAERVLLLHAGLPEADLKTVVAAWSRRGATHLGFARLDETSACGSLLNLLADARLPLALLSTGPAVPEDLAIAGLELLADRLLAAGNLGRPAARNAAASAPRWVANRNSDLYHRPECRWVKRISARHLEGFESPAAAEAASYRPCRDCMPEAAPSAPDAVGRISARG